MLFLKILMLNFRKLKKDYSPAILKDGKDLFDNDRVSMAKIVSINHEVIRISGQVLGAHDHWYESEVEIDRRESELLDSNCDCPYTYDCQHLAALVFYLEKHFDQILVTYSKEADLDQCQNFDEKEKEKLRETFKQAESKEVVRRGKQYDRDLLGEYRGAAELLGQSSFFLPEETCPATEISSAFDEVAIRSLSS